MNDKVAKIFELANFFNRDAVLAEVVKNDPEDVYKRQLISCGVAK